MVTLSNVTTAEIPADVGSLAEIEKTISSIFALRGGNLAVAPGTLSKRRGAFLDPALLQAIITWARLSPTGKLRLGHQGHLAASKALEESCDYAVGIGALAVAPEIVAAGEVTSRSAALKPATGRMEAAYEGDFSALQRGRSADLIAVGGAARQYLSPLFARSNPAVVKDKFGLKATVRGLALQAHPNADELLSDSTYSALATLTHELFENTQEHAGADIQLQPYRRHIEAMFVSWMSLSDSVARADFFGNATLRDYWASIAGGQSPRQQPAGLCISFVDSGPGMAARLLGKEYASMSDAEERHALLECLKIHVSTKPSRAAGGGLSEVLTELSALDALVRIRSGRLSIFKCFAPGVRRETLVDGFENWFDNDRALARVAGTLVSIFIPLPRL